MLSVRIEFGYWVFEGDLQPIQRPSWNYRKRRRRRHHPRHGVPLALRAGQPVRRGASRCRASAPRTSRSAGTKPASPTRATADDAAYATFELDGRRRRADRGAGQQLVGHARAARRSGHLPCRRHARLGGRRPAGLPHPVAREHAAAGVEPRREADDELLRAVAGGARHAGLRQRLQGRSGSTSSATSCEDAPYRWTLAEGAKGVQLVEAALQSWKERRWVDVPALDREEKRHEP